MEHIGLTPTDVVFRPIVGFPAYHISNIGTVLNWKTEKLLKQIVCIDYCRVSLCIGGIVKTKYIHRLVAEAFIPNPEDKTCVDHIDHDKLNNALQNLRWATPVENQHNRVIQTNNSSGYAGVTCTRHNKWEARVKMNRTRNIRNIWRSRSCTESVRSPIFRWISAAPHLLSNLEPSPKHLVTTGNKMLTQNAAPTWHETNKLRVREYIIESTSKIYMPRGNLKW